MGRASGWYPVLGGAIMLRVRATAGPATFIILLAVATFVEGTLEAQETVAGRVIEAATGAPMSGVQVFIDVLDLGVLSSGNGRYVLLNIPVGTHSLTVERLGYRSQSLEVTVAQGATVQADFQLLQEALALDEIIVTGTPGGTRRRAIGNVVGRIDARLEAELYPITDVRGLIAARNPGVSVQKASGSVGSGSVIRVRGVSSLSLNNGPIIYVDGIRVDSGIRGFAGIARQAGSRLDDFNPEDIESIEVIKGPAAATLYGTEASNGVIQIITKRGTEGSVVFNLSSRVGTHWMPNPRRHFGNKWWKDPDTGELQSVFLYDHERDFQGGRPYVDYGSNQYYQLGATGGTDLVRFSASINWDREFGVFPRHPNLNTSQGGRFNIDFLASEDLTVSASLGYVHRYHEQPEFSVGRGPMINMLTGVHPNRAPTRRGMDFAVPEDIEDITTWANTNRFTGSTTVNHTPTAWLSQRLTLGVDESHEFATRLYPRSPRGAAGPFGRRALGERTDEASRLSSYTFDYAGTVTIDVNEGLQSATSAGFQYYERKTVSNGAIGRIFPATPLTALSAAADREGSGDFLENKTVGLYIQEQLAFGDNFFITGAIRADDNSAFGAEFDRATYPKLSATWTLEEPFAVAPWLETLRLRSAWGAAGQQPDLFAAVQLYDPVTGSGGSSAVTPGEFGNSELKPERSEEIEVGFDASVFDGRADVQFTFYNRTTEDALVLRDLAPSAGFPGRQWVNVAEVKNWGTETSVQTAIIRPGGRLAWNLGVAFATMHNRLERLGLAEGITQLSEGRGIRHVEGQPLASSYDYRILSADFVSGDSGPVTNVMCDGGNGNPVPFGECEFVSWGGPSNPTWELNVSSDFTLFQNWRLAARVEGRGGHVLHDKDLTARVSCCPSARVVWAEDEPVFVAYSNLRREGVGFFDAGFVRLRELSLIYELPQNLVERVGATRASLGVQMINVGFLWRASKYTIEAEERLTGDNKESFYIPEPDIGTQGNHYAFVQGRLPTKTVLVSARLTF